ncbi:hypothetical protein [[Mycoplasma] anseris]|uniref:DUF1292 domain-containing protein n=1 Tax=[Mycoplasma] anseris TaxID=92400 RepID=A0A2Z4NDS5_9BACT|nr:hypothetical protein [[Mycoplasma] anseris]AWX69710.1 hypothetical protein DP065_03070 [[Mycoplasma] anseris]
MEKQKFNLFVEERKIQINNETFYIILEFEENGDHYLIVTNKDVIISFKADPKNPENLLPIYDEEAKELEIIETIINDYYDHNLLLDEEGNDFLARFFEDQEEEEEIIN